MLVIFQEIRLIKNVVSTPVHSGKSLVPPAGFCANEASSFTIREIKWKFNYQPDCRGSNFIAQFWSKRLWNDLLLVVAFLTTTTTTRRSVSRFPSSSVDYKCMLAAWRQCDWHERERKFNIVLLTGFRVGDGCYLGTITRWIELFPTQIVCIESGYAGSEPRL